MMIKTGAILGVDTSALHSSIAIKAPDGSILEWISGGDSVSHNEELTSQIGVQLSRAHLSVSDLSALVIGTGPGSFTGLRIGLSVLKGLAVALRIPLIARSSLGAMAMMDDSGMLVVSVSDARRGEVFFLPVLRQSSGVLQPVEEASIVTPSQAAQRIRSISEQFSIAPSGVAIAYADPHPSLTYGGELFSYRSYQATHIARGLLLEEISENRGYSIEEISKIEPNYLRAVAAKTIAERAI